MTTYTATITKTQEAPKAGTYVPTDIDVRKEAADIRIVSVEGNYTVISKVGIKGRGIKPRSTPGTYEVTRNALDKLRSAYSVECDF